MAYIADYVQQVSVNWLAAVSGTIVPTSVTFPTSAKTGDIIKIGLQVLNAGEVPSYLFAALYATAPVVGASVDLSTAIVFSKSSSEVAVNSVLDLTADANKLVYGPMPAGGTLAFYLVTGHIVALLSDSFPGSSLSSAWLVNSAPGISSGTLAIGTNTLTVASNSLTVQAGSSSSWNDASLIRPVSIAAGQDFTASVNFTSNSGYYAPLWLTLLDGNKTTVIAIGANNSGGQIVNPLQAYYRVGNSSSAFGTVWGSGSGPISGVLSITRKSGVLTLSANGRTVTASDNSAYAYIGFDVAQYNGYGTGSVVFKGLLVTTP